MTDTVSFGFRRVSPGDKKRLVQEHFDPIASTYNLADVVLSGGLDLLWRRRAVRLLGLRRGDRVLDVCGGTAGLALLALRKSGSDGCAVVYDFDRAMMEAGRKRGGREHRSSRLWYVQGDAEQLSFPANAFDAVTLGFGLRNLASPEQGLARSTGFFVRRRPDDPRVLSAGQSPASPALSLLFVPGHASSCKTRLRYCGAIPLSCRIHTCLSVTGGNCRFMIQSGFFDVRFLRFANGLAVAYFGCKPPLTDWREEKK